MSAKRLTDDEVKKLSMSKHVRKATNDAVFFTPYFKVLFWEKYSHGVDPSAIFAQEGIDPEILGKSRISRFKSSVLKKAKNNLADNSDEAEAKIRILEQQISLKNQQIEFLKKVASLAPENINDKT